MKQVSQQFRNILSQSVIPKPQYRVFLNGNEYSERLITELLTITHKVSTSGVSPNDIDLRFYDEDRVVENYLLSQDLIDVEVRVSLSGANDEITLFNGYADMTDLRRENEVLLVRCVGKYPTVLYDSVKDAFGIGLIQMYKPKPFYEVFDILGIVADTEDLITVTDYNLVSWLKNLRDLGATELPAFGSNAYNFIFSDMIIWDDDGMNVRFAVTFGKYLYIFTYNRDMREISTWYWQDVQQALGISEPIYYIKLLYAGIGGVIGVAYKWGTYIESYLMLAGFFRIDEQNGMPDPYFDTTSDYSASSPWFPGLSTTVFYRLDDNYFYGLHVYDYDSSYVYFELMRKKPNLGFGTPTAWESYGVDTSAIPWSKMPSVSTYAFITYWGGWYEYNNNYRIAVFGNPRRDSNGNFVLGGVMIAKWDINNSTFALDYLNLPDFRFGILSRGYNDPANDRMNFLSIDAGKVLSFDQNGNNSVLDTGLTDGYVYPQVYCGDRAAVKQTKFWVIDGTPPNITEKGNVSQSFFHHPQNIGVLSASRTGFIQIDDNVGIVFSQYTKDDITDIWIGQLKAEIVPYVVIGPDNIEIESVKLLEEMAFQANCMLYIESETVRFVGLTPKIPSDRTILRSEYERGIKTEGVTGYIGYRVNALDGNMEYIPPQGEGWTIVGKIFEKTFYFSLFWSLQYALEKQRLANVKGIRKLRITGQFPEIEIGDTVSVETQDGVFEGRVVEDIMNYPLDFEIIVQGKPIEVVASPPDYPVTVFCEGIAEEITDTIKGPDRRVNIQITVKGDAEKIIVQTPDNRWLEVPVMNGSAQIEDFVEAGMKGVYGVYYKGMPVGLIPVETFGDKTAIDFGNGVITYSGGIIG